MITLGDDTITYEDIKNDIYADIIGELGENPPEGVLQEMCQDCLVNGRLSLLECLQKEFGRLEIPEYVVQKCYLRHAIDGEFGRLNSLKRVTEIEPKFLAAEAREIFAHYLLRGKVDSFKEFKTLTRIEPELVESDIQSCYEICLNTGKVGFVLELMRETRIKPSARLIHEGYEYLVRSKQFGFVSLLGATGVRPREDLIHEAYDFYFDQDLDYCRTLLRLEELTSVEPNFPEAAVQEKYANCVLDFCDMDRLRDWQTLTGIEPDLPKGVVQKGYKLCLNLLLMDELEGLWKLTNISPRFSPRDVEMNYSLWLARGNYDEVLRLYEISGVSPERVIKLEYGRPYRDKDYERRRRERVEKMCEGGLERWLPDQSRS